MSDWSRSLPEQVRSHLEDVHALVARGDHRFAPPLLRTMIEVTARNVLGSDWRGFRKALLDLHRRGLLGAQDLRRMMEVLEAANDAVHQGRLLSPDAVEHMVLCVERLLQSAYVLREPPPELRTG